MNLLISSVNSLLIRYKTDFGLQFVIRYFCFLRNLVTTNLFCKSLSTIFGTRNCLNFSRDSIEFQLFYCVFSLSTRNTNMKMRYRFRIGKIFYSCSFTETVKESYRWWYFTIIKQQHKTVMVSTLELWSGTRLTYVSPPLNFHWKLISDWLKSYSLLIQKVPLGIEKNK